VTDTIRAIAVEKPKRLGRMTDLVRQAQDGDRTAFERLYREHVGRVYALCLRLASDPARAEELTQDAFVSAWRKLGSFRGDAAFSSWLHRIAINTIFMAGRSERRRRSRIDEVDPRSAETAGPRATPGLKIDLERAIAALPPGARSVFVLHDIEGYRHAEIAELTGLAVGTLKAQLHRARRLLREKLGS
jgi:RNA polymerase sigma-70 factor (ECF subfamily)